MACVLTIKSRNRRCRKDYQDPHRRQDVKDAVKLNEHLKSVELNVTPMDWNDHDFDYMNPIGASVIFEDVHGRTSVVHLLGVGLEANRLTEWQRRENCESDECALNVILNYFNLLAGGKIIGVNWDLSEAIRYAEEKYPKQSNHHSGKDVAENDKKAKKVRRRISD